MILFRAMAYFRRRSAIVLTVTAVGRKNSIGVVRLPIGTHDAILSGRVSQ